MLIDLRRLFRGPSCNLGIGISLRQPGDADPMRERDCQIRLDIDDLPLDTPAIAPDPRFDNFAVCAVAAVSLGVETRWESSRGELIDGVLSELSRFIANLETEDDLRRFADRGIFRSAFVHRNVRHALGM